jgi:hypothetical protein
VNEEKSISFGWYTWVGWVLASAFGTAAGFAISVNLLSILSSDISSALNEVLIFGLILAAMGTLQWLVLRSQISQAGWWIVASIVSGTVLGIMATLFSTGAEVNPIIGYGLFGITLGVPQWLVLRRQLSHSWLWLIASPIGWTLAVLVVTALGRTWQQVSETTGLILGFGLMGAVVGMITGTLLIWLLRQSYLPIASLSGQKPA